MLNMLRCGMLLGLLEDALCSVVVARKALTIQNQLNPFAHCPSYVLFAPCSLSRAPVALSWPSGDDPYEQLSHRGPELQQFWR